MCGYFNKLIRLLSVALAGVLAVTVFFSSRLVIWGAEEDGPGAVQTELAYGPGTQSVILKLTLDGDPMPEAEVTLRQEKEIVYAMTAGPGADEFTVDGDVKDGIYNIYIDGKDSGRTLNVSDHVGAAKVTMFTVTFLMTADGEEVEVKNVFLGDVVDKPDLDGEKFEGWMTEEEKEYDFSEEVSQKTVLHGKWTSLENEVDCGVENAFLEGAEDVTYGEAFEGKLVAEEGYELPEEIQIFSGEEEITEFSYDPETGVISIPEGVITGDLSVQGVSVEGKSYLVTTEIVNGALVGSTASELTGYSGFILPNTGYAPPKEITATMNGEPFTEFTYDSSGTNGTGDIRILPEYVKGPVTFSGTCVPKEGSLDYRIISAIGHGTVYYERTQTQKELEVQIVPEEGYEFPQQLLIVSAGKRFKDFDYNSDTGILRISSAKINSLVISANCPEGDSMVKVLHGTK